MRKLVLGVMLALCFIGGYTTFAYSHGYRHHGGLSIGITPFIAIQPPSIVVPVPPAIVVPVPPAIVIGGPPVVYEQRYYRRRYVRRHVIRRKAVVQQVPTTTQTTVVTQQIPLTPPPLLPPPAPRAATVPPPPAPRAVTVTPEIAVETTVVQPVVATEIWYYTNVDCCYVYFDQQWLWDSDLWYHHHFRGHYYERSPEFWARYGFNEPYWRRFERGRRYVQEERRWIRGGQVYASPVRERFSVQPQWAYHDRGRHLGWEHQRGWERQGGWERHAGHGWGHLEGHGRGHGHGKK